ncbi:crotonobetainyl-CoA:carnitine CoA-transferase CaiB-like acyl-CoA transferase [Allocatelliglobosispora scoriae]|uniref:Crotonobetainyl-CoA:carnitine CoA-transferase CaiB-like acyl-CoA transferase n=1 Tax=Allocatelliglobosispora scoriae TaxID=643052 RepID=A0A841C0N2_9ACTN|nr:CoA transferase [Allocatelliglobosispora scoriae]MBB5872612.1 crotonobetainyl-CoA:carnitine CoA-transferase CaiB-like acyl-CoA transferase [Allocatelliglobosispora scoriae]
MTVDDAVNQAWQALGGGAHPAEPHFDPASILPARLPVGDLANATVAACALAAAELAAARGRQLTGPILIDPARVATAFVGERHLRVDGRAFESFAPESAFFAAADGWVRTHANYPHHAERLRSVLGADVAAAIAALPAAEVEERVTAAGGLAVAVRRPEEWAAHEQGKAVADLPLVAWRQNPSPVRPPAPLPSGHLLPATGLRVLDLTRVIAGPVATRALAQFGAEVLRIDSPDLPEATASHLDTGIGKRSTLLDLGRAHDRAEFEELLASADVVVTGYRPGSLDRFGLDPDALLERRPGLVVGRLSAWGTTGPWAGRRGFDSLVQAASGIAVIEGDDGRPGVLPAQALDHGTGYLLAAAVLRAIAAQLDGGGGYVVELALARTAGWLTGLPTAAGGAAAELAPSLGEVGGVTCAQPAVVLPGGLATWRAPARPWGGDPPAWDQI